MMEGRHMKGGFSLIEILIAIAILAIVSVVVVPGYMSYMESARVSRAESNLRSIKGAIDSYALMVGQLPGRLKDLVQKPADEKAARRWTGALIDQLPEDPWGNNYQYKVTPAGSAHPYELYSYGKEGKGAPQAEWIDVWKI
jgi:general secretion pathway protein G